MRLPIRSTIRLRLTLLYGGLFFLAGALLLVLTYALIGRVQPPPERGLGENILAFEGASQTEDAAATDEAVTPGSPIAGGFLTREEARALMEERERARDEWLRSIRTQSGIALLVTSVGALALGWVVAGRVLRPIRDITSHAQQLSSANLDERIALRGPRDELRELADTMDAMLDRLQAAFESQRRFSAQVSHELRTPLSIMRAEADVALANPGATSAEAELAANIRTAVVRCEGLIDGLLALARSESTMRDHEGLDLAELAGDMVGESLEAARVANVRIDLTLDSAFVIGDRALLERLMGNLIDNAVRYNLAGGWVSVTVGRTASNAILRVENSGPILNQADVVHFVTPFQRGAQSGLQTGYGLGLPIALAIARAHAGSLELRACEDGGLVVQTLMPLDPSPLVTANEASYSAQDQPRSIPAFADPYSRSSGVAEQTH